MFAYCTNSPVNCYDPSGCRPAWEHNFGNGFSGYTDTGTGSYSTPANYKEYDSEEESYYHNCYSYAFDLPMGCNPGFFNYLLRHQGSLDYPKWYSPGYIADLVLKDMEALGRKARVISTPEEATADERVVALKTGTYIFSCGFTDYHFCVQLSDGTWADKPGSTNPRWNAIDGTAATWPLSGVSTDYYCSTTCYFAIGW